MELQYYGTIMKKLLTIITALGITACSTTNTSNLASQHTNAHSPDELVCFYTQKPGWHLKEKHCMPRKLYETSKLVFMPPQPSTPINVDNLPSSGK